jgi:ketosteroid isomerase-like protein
MVLASGQECGLIEGTAPLMDGVTFYFGCTDGYASFPGTRTEPWTVNYAAGSSSPVTPVAVTTAFAWARPQPASAVSATENDQSLAPSPHFRILTIEEGDKVVERDTVTGTHQGEYMGLPPTGKSVAYNEIFIMRFVNGRIAEIWGVVDVFSQMKRLGMIPA